MQLNKGKRAHAILVLCATAATVVPAQTFTTVHRFKNSDGALPEAALVQATDGDFYGTTSEGGTNRLGNTYAGTIFKITPDGSRTSLHRFCAQSACADGARPVAALIQANNGDFYGTTSEGGVYGGGTIFKIAPGGTLTTLYAFCSLSECADGRSPSGALVQATDGNFYGTTAGDGYSGAATIFKINPGGTLTTLYTFCSQGGTCPDGTLPEGALIQATDGS